MERGTSGLGACIQAGSGEVRKQGSGDLDVTGRFKMGEAHTGLTLENFARSITNSSPTIKESFNSKKEMVAEQRTVLLKKRYLPFIYKGF